MRHFIVVGDRERSGSRKVVKGNRVDVSVATRAHAPATDADAEPEPPETGRDETSERHHWGSEWLRGGCGES